MNSETYPQAYNPPVHTAVSRNSSPERPAVPRNEAAIDNARRPEKSHHYRMPRFATPAQNAGISRFRRK